MAKLADIEHNLSKDDTLTYTKPTNSLKAVVSKFTFILTTLPPFIIIMLTLVLSLKLIYAFIFIIIYLIILYWLLETKFTSILYYAEKIKNIITPYIQKLTSVTS